MAGQHLALGDIDQPPRGRGSCSASGPAGDVDLGLGIDNEVQGAPISICRGLRGTWEQLWPQVRHVN